MKTLKSGETHLNRAEHSVMVESLRRRGRFGTPNYSLTTQWTGLGTANEYKAAMNAGFMVRVSNPNPRHLEWWRLTDKGALIIAFWIGQGYTFERIEAGDLPSALIPAAIL